MPARLLGLLLAMLLTSALPLRDAVACGMFVPLAKVKAPPRMEQERTLILWDASTRRQHFVREVRFTNTGEVPFGFVVPTPARPEVADVPAPPFEALEMRFPHTLLDTPETSFGAPGSKGGGEGSDRGIAAGGAPPPVQVLEKKRIGDFTSFVLAASDAKALADWLKKNQFRASEAGQKWIERYVKLGFFFVALRYEGKKPKAGEGEGLVSRSVRFSFDSALPYYPYEEPADAPEQRGRELQVWLVTQGLHLPLAPVTTSDGVSLRRPWSEGVRYDDVEPEIRSSLGSELGALVPTGSRLMTFGDWKEHRRGFGDLVLVPAQPEGCDLACVTARRPLMALLDPGQGAASADAAALVVPPPVPRAPRSAPRVQSSPPAIATGSPFANSLTLGCGIARSGSGSGFGLVALLGALFARRARRRGAKLAALGVALLSLVACASPPPPPPPPPAPVASGSATPAPAASVAGEPEPGIVPPGKLDTFALPPEGAERQKAVMRLLAGQHDEKLIPVWSTPSERGIGHARRGASNAIPDPNVIERTCAPDERIEGSVSFVVDSDDSGAPRAHVEGPFPTPVLACVESVLVSQGPRIGRGVERGVLSFGALTPDVMSLRRRIKDSKFVSAPGPGVIRVKRSSSSVTPNARLPREVVDRVMAQNMSRFRACYGRDTHPAATGTVTLKFDIGRDGAVTSMAATAADVAGTTGLCIGNAVRRMSFPSPEGGSVKVTYTLGFERGK